MASRRIEARLALVWSKLHLGEPRSSLRAKRSNPGERRARLRLLDRRVASLLAMTIPSNAGCASAPARQRTGADSATHGGERRRWRLARGTGRTSALPAIA